MKLMNKRIISLLLTLALLCGIVPTAFAAEAEHTHTYENGICTGCGEVMIEPLHAEIPITKGQFCVADGEWEDSDIYGCVIGYELKKGHTLSISDADYVFSVRKLSNGNYNTLVKDITADAYTATESMTVAIRVQKPDESALTSEELANVTFYDTQYGMTDVPGYSHRFTVEAATIHGSTATTRAAIFLPPDYDEKGTPTRLIVMTNGLHGHLNDTAWNSNTADDVGVMKHYMNNGYAVLVVDNTARQTRSTTDLGNPQLISSYWEAYEYVQTHFNIEEMFAIHSRSQGTFAAVRIMREHPELVRCALMCGAVTSLKSRFAQNPVFIANRFGFTDTTGATYEADKVAGYDPYSDVNGIEYALPPTLWMLSTSDANKSVLSTIDKIEAHGNDVTVVTYTETDHSGVCRLNIEACREDSLAFLERYQESTAEHRFCAWKTVKAATCTETGEMRRYCADCEHYETMQIPALSGHVFENSETVCGICGMRFDVACTEIILTPGQFSNTTGKWVESNIYGCVIGYELKAGHTLSISDTDYVFAVRVLKDDSYATMVKKTNADAFTADEDMVIAARVRKPDKSALTEEELAAIVLYDTFYTEHTHTYENGICTGCGEVIPDTAEPLTLRYDDRYDVTGKVVEIIDAGMPTSYQVGYGVEENKVLDVAVVTLKDNALVATGIGTATVKVDGETYEITVTAAPISLLLLIGQSNMQGSEGDENQSIVCPDGMVYSTYGDRYTMTTSNATNFAPSALTGAGSELNVNGTTTNLEDWPVYLLNERGVGKKGPDSGFAYEWVKQTGEKVWVVNAAHGGSAISTWQKSGANYKEAVALFSACQDTLQKEISAGHYTLSHMGYFWCQGCSDASQTAEWYVNKYLTMHENLKSALSFDEDTTFEFGGIVPILYGTNSYRAGIYADKNIEPYYESFELLTFNGPRVAQYWMTNNPDLPDIWNVCNIGEDWVWMPDDTNGVTEYFQSHYPNGTVDYTTQVQQSVSWYTPTTPAAVHDSIHYNQIGYNEVGREAARNALIMLGEIEAPEVETSVQFLSWDGYTEVTQINAATAVSSGTLVVPMVYPVWESKNVTYAVTEGMSYKYYDLLADSPLNGGMLYAVGFNEEVAVQGRELNSYSWELENGLLVSSGEVKNAISRVTGTTENNIFIDMQYRFDNPIVLLHDQNWVLEWKMTGPWYDSDSTTSQKLFCQDGASATPGSMCLMIKGNENRISIGYYGTNTHISYGLDLDDYGISIADTHVYRLENQIHDDGTNMIYLLVDGKQIGPMAQYFTGSGGYMGSQSDYLNGKDLSFGYLGTPKYLLDQGTVEYIMVVESNADSDIHFHDWSDWETVKAPDKNGPGEQNRTCRGCGEMETQIVTSIWQTTNILKHWNELPEAVCSDLNLWAIMEHDPKYYVNSKGDWDYHSSQDVPSVTFAVNPGDKIHATSFGAAKVNGHGSANGIRVTWFGIDGVIKTTDPGVTYAEFNKNGGYLIAPEGAVAINIPMWNNSDSNEIYILNRDHTYENGICTGCGAAELGYHLPGDINGDGSVNNKDFTRLFQYLADWDVEVVEAALDVNGDGSVNNKDLTRLFQYLSDWDVELK